MSPIAKPIPLDLRPPEFRPCRGKFEHWAIVTVPKAAVNKRYGTIAGKDEIRSPRKIGGVEAVPKTGGVKPLSQLHLWFSVAAPYSAHIEATALGRMDIGPCASAPVSHAHSPKPAVVRVVRRPAQALTGRDQKGHRIPARHP